MNDERRETRDERPETVAQTSSAKFDEAAFDAAVSRPNGWSDVPDHVAEIRQMRDGEQPGNAAAMREALERAIDAIQVLIALYDEEHTAAVKTGATWKRSDTSEVDAIVEQARAALSAPPRNCDRFATYEEAVEAYRAWAERTTGNVSNVSGRGMLGWLFAPVKGGGAE